MSGESLVCVEVVVRQEWGQKVFVGKSWVCMICFLLLSLVLSFSTHRHILPSFSSIFHHYFHVCMTLYSLLISFSNWSRYRHEACLFNLGSAQEPERCKNNDLCLATNKNWPPHLFCIWGPIMCELKGETPQEGINRRQSGDRARHGGQMAERQPLWVQSVFLLPRRQAEDGTALDPWLVSARGEHMAHYWDDLRRHIGVRGGGSV